MKNFGLNTIKVIAPAKVNLFLAVGAAGSVEGVDPGKHPVLNIMHTLVMHDTIYLEVVDDGVGTCADTRADTRDATFRSRSDGKKQIDVEFLQSDDLDVELPEVEPRDNLVYQAIKQLADLCLCGGKGANNSSSSAVVGHAAPKARGAMPTHIRAYIEKNIPSGAGLAGGSSDAAAALVGAAKLFKIEPDDKRLAQVAKNLGSDVPFFLQGGCALYTGAGEVLDHKIAPINREIVIVKPMHTSLSTAAVYAQFDKLPQTHADLGEILHATQQIQYADGLPMFNNLAPAAENLAPDLAQIRTWLADICKPENVLLCGSGACTFAFVPDDEDGEHIAQHAREQGWWASTTSLANVSARVIPAAL